MQWFTRLRRSRLILLSGVLLAVGGGSVAAAAIPDADGVVHGCYAKSGGSLRVIDSATGKCKSTETSLSWNQKGPVGPQGPKGDAGGLSDAFTGAGYASIGGDQYTEITSLQLPAGKYVLVGKGQVLNQQDAAEVVSCNVYDSAGGFVDSSTVAVPNPSTINTSSYGTLAFQSVVKLAAPGAVHVECITGGTSGINVNARLTATTVGSVTVTP